jgi:hypothetical protein
MVKRFALVVFVLGSIALSGCRFVAPVFEEAGGCGRAGGCGCPGGAGCGPDTKSKAMLRQWGADARRNEQFVDTYFFNYDINDPYRGDCLGSRW